MAKKKGLAKKKAAAKGRKPKATKPATTQKRYWLVKTEPESYSIDDLAAAPDQTTFWNGVRNYQARNMLRDEMKQGDLVLVYHSNAEPPAIVGIAEVVREGYPDSSAFDKTSQYHDEKSKADSPTWYMVDIKLVRKLNKPLGLPLLRTRKELAKMELLRQGSRLSVQPVRESEYTAILALADG